MCSWRTDYRFVMGDTGLYLVYIAMPARVQTHKYQRIRPIASNLLATMFSSYNAKRDFIVDSAAR